METFGAEYAKIFRFHPQWNDFQSGFNNGEILEKTTILLVAVLWRLKKIILLKVTVSEHLILVIKAKIFQIL